MPLAHAGGPKARNLQRRHDILSAPNKITSLLRRCFPLPSPSVRCRAEGPDVTSGAHEYATGCAVSETERAGARPNQTVAP